MEAFSDSDGDDEADPDDIRHSAGVHLAPPLAPVVAGGYEVGAAAGSPATSPVSSSAPDRRLSQGGITPVLTPAHVGAAAALAASPPVASPAQAPSPPSAAAAVPSYATHVVVFLDGLGGTTHDTRLLRSYLKLWHPHVLAYVTTSNQAKATEGDIIESAARVAKEVHDFLVFKLPEDGLTLHCLSFVAFSLGGVVARLALRHPLMRSFLPRCHAFVSVASPHLGLLYSQSAVVSAGVFLFRQWRSSQALSQLSFTDEDATTPDGIRNSLLYVLAVGWQGKLAPPPAADAAARARLRAAPPGAAATPPAAGGSAFVPAALRLYEHAGGAVRDSDEGTGSEVEGAHGPHAGSGGGGGGSGRPASSPSAVVHSVGSRDTSGDFSDIADALEAEAAEEVRHTAESPQRPLLPGASRTLQALHKHGFSPVPNGALLAHFNRIVLLHSDQDAYAPTTSCAVQWCPAALADGKNGAAYGEMLRGFFDGVAPTAITRWGVHYKNLSSIFAGKISVDSLLGREAHVSFLETEQVAYAVAVGLDVWDTRLHPPPPRAPGVPTGAAAAAPSTPVAVAPAPAPAP